MISTLHKMAEVSPVATVGHLLGQGFGRLSRVLKCSEIPADRREFGSFYPAVNTNQTITVDDKPRNFLTESETTRFLEAARKGRYGSRDFCLCLLAYRHGFRVSELIDVRVSDIDLDGAQIRVRRKKGSLSTSQPLAGDEMRAIRACLRDRETPNSPYLFLGERGPVTRQAFNYLCDAIGKRAGLAIHVHPHMLRHSCGFALANKGRDTRLIQDWLGHRNIRHTELYTRTAAIRFEGIWT